MGFPINDLGKALTTQIYLTVMGGDDKVPPPKDTFFTWVMGMPITADDLDFCGEGIFSAPTAEEMKQRLTHAFNLSMLLDFIPDIDAPYSTERQEGMYKPDAEKRLSQLYRELLRFSKVVDYELTDAQKAKIAKFRSLLTTTREVTDLITDEKKEITEAGPMLKAYNDKMSAYVAASLEYNAKRVAAAAAGGPEGRAAVADWATNQQLYALKVKATADAWTASGYRNEIDQINAYINQTTQRSLVLWKQQLMEDFDKAVLSSPEVPLPFPYTTLIPGNIATSDGWTEIGVSHESVAWSQHNEAQSWKAGAGLSLGLFNFGGAGGGSSSSNSRHFECSAFKMTFELAQAVIYRPINTLFLASRGWTLRPGEGWTFDQLPSDGGDPPKGSFVGYATQVLFARNVKITSADFVSNFKQAQSEWGASAGVGYGPFMLSGSYSRSTGDQQFDSKADGETLTVKGMQVIGFVNHLLGKTPDPLPDIPQDQFV
jgi:hypothetical protein